METEAVDYNQGCDVPSDNSPTNTDCDETNADIELLDLMEMESVPVRGL